MPDFDSADGCVLQYRSRSTATDVVHGFTHARANPGGSVGKFIFRSTQTMRSTSRFSKPRSQYVCRQLCSAHPTGAAIQDWIEQVACDGLYRDSVGSRVGGLHPTSQGAAIPATVEPSVKRGFSTSAKGNLRCDRQHISSYRSSAF